MCDSIMNIVICFVFNVLVYVYYILTTHITCIYNLKKTLLITLLLFDIHLDIVIAFLRDTFFIELIL